jgi:hypothetical protein
MFNRHARRIAIVCFLAFSLLDAKTATSADQVESAATLGRQLQLELSARRVEILANEVDQLQSEILRLRLELSQGEDRCSDIELTRFDKEFDEDLVVELEAEEPLGQRQEVPREPFEEAFGRPEDPGLNMPSLSGYGEGLDLGFWGWVSYLYTPQADRSTFWAWEAELDITKTFTDRIAASADIDFTDTPFDEARARIEQLFLSVVLPNKHETLVTAGKFNAPFGVEPRDFWDRLTGSTSLLFRAQPQDLTGIMITQRLDKGRVVLRPFVVNGFDDSLDVNQQPSIGMMAEYRPHQDVQFAWTNWWGPEFPRENAETLYFMDAQASWFLGTATTLAAEYLLATGESPFGHVRWNGLLALVNYDCNDLWRIFGRWSFLHDPDGFVTGTHEDRHELSTGVGYYLHPAVELRMEYRHDFRSRATDLDTLEAHLTFGY